MKRGLYSLMNWFSVSSASASEATSRNSIWWIRDTISIAPRVAPAPFALEKCPATRLRIDFAFPT